MSMSKRFHIFSFCLSFAGFCVSFAKLQMETFQGFTDEGLVFTPLQHGADSHYSIWLYLTIGFLLCTIFWIWRLFKLRHKT